MTESVFSAGSEVLPAQARSSRPVLAPAPVSFQRALDQAATSRPVVAGAPAFAMPQPCPAAAVDALCQAMAREGVPSTWQSELAFIMARESGGRVDAQSAVHSARGLYQLTAANYHYNPRGAASFGDAVEEAQGGIRYIRARYGTAESAAAFWRQHGWY